MDYFKCPKVYSVTFIHIWTLSMVTTSLLIILFQKCNTYPPTVYSSLGYIYKMKHVGIESLKVLLATYLNYLIELSLS